MTKFIVNGKQGYKTYHDWKAFWGMKGAPSTPPVPPVDYTIPLYIEAPADSPNPSGWDISLPSSGVRGNTRHIEYSFDRVTWTSVTLQNDQNGSFANPVCHIDKGQKVYLRGSNVSWAYYNDNNFRLKITSEGHFSGIKVGGNIMSILYGENFTGEERSFPTGSTYTFTGFFSDSYSTDSNAISDVSELLLPATTMVNQCYRGLFSGRSAITTAPELPATTLANNCYGSMFNGCTSLTTAPTLPATTLAEHCYSSMFSLCTSLTSAPALPATTLAEGCYYQMFSNCTSLTTAPALPATTLVRECYSNMFWNCYALTTAPALPATTLAERCYDSMFGGCRALTTAPTLPATTLASGCYNRMFYGCTSLTTAPILPATTLVSNCYYNMFQYCSSLNYIKCLAVDDESYTGDFRTYCEGWVDGVSSSGTFIASDNYSSGWYWGKDGVPENWTTQTESGNHFEPAQGGGSGGSQIYQSNGLTVYEMGSGQGGYQVEANGSLMMVPGFDGNDWCFAMMKISADQGRSRGVPMTPYLGNGVTAYISKPVSDDGTCPFSYNEDDEYIYEYSLTSNDDGTQISSFIMDGNCRWVKFVKNQGTYDYNTPYISMGF